MDKFASLRFDLRLCELIPVSAQDSIFHISPNISIMQVQSILSRDENQRQSPAASQC